MDPDFVVHVKRTLFWLNRALSVYLDMDVLNFPKSTSKFPFCLNTLLVQNTVVWSRFWLKDQSNRVKPSFAKTPVQFCQ